MQSHRQTQGTQNRTTQQSDNIAQQSVSNALMQNKMSNYQVQTGDTLWDLAQRFGTSVSALQSSNQLFGSLIQVGQVLSVPGGSQDVATPQSQAGSYTVRSGDSLWAIAKDNGTTIDALRTANGLNRWSTIHPGDVLKMPSQSAPSQSAPSQSAPSQSAPSQSAPSQSAPSQGPSQSAPTPAPAAPAPAKDKGGYNPALGAELARASRAENGGSRYSTKRCYEYVANAVDRVIGRFMYGEHAYMAANQLAQRKHLFVETSASSLSSLPAGAIVVWSRGNTKSGHISISLGDGQESSDFIGPQMLSHYGGGSARAFLPKARM